MTSSGTRQIRSRVTRAALTAALAGALVVGTAACTPRQNAASFAAVTSSTITDQLPAATKSVDKVTWAVVEGEPQTLDPTNTANVITPNICTSLLTVNADYSISPGLATKADWVNPVTFRITLRHGLKFSDGSALTADDVVWCLRRNMNEASQWYAAFVLVKSMKAVDSDTVDISFKAPDASFRNSLTGGAGQVLSKAAGTKAGKALGTSAGGLVCDGPYKLAKWVPGTSIDVAANPYYWAGEPRTKTISFRFISDSSTLTNALTAGEIDGAYNVSPGARAALETSSTGKLYVGHSTTSYSFGPMASKGPAADPRVREALSLAIDRDKYVATVLQGLGYKQRTIVAPFTFSQSPAKDILQKGYDGLYDQHVDLTRARALLKASGEDLSKPLVLAIPSGAREMEQTALIIQDAAKKIGLTIQINQMQASDFGALFYSSDPGSSGVDLVATTAYLETPEYLGYPTLFMVSPEEGGFYNWSGYSNKKVAGLMNAARVATSPDQQAKDFVAAQQTFTPDNLQVTLAGAYQLTYLSNRLTGVVTSVAMYSAPLGRPAGRQVERARP